MRTRIITFATILALGTLAFAPQASAFGLRVGGTSIVDPGTAHMFSIGTDNDTMFIPWVGLNSGSTFHVNDDVLAIDGFLGLIGKIPIAMAGKFKVTIRADFLVKYGYFFDGPRTHAISVGGMAGPGIEFDLGKVALGFDVDVQFYKDMWYDAGREYDEFIIAISYMAVLHF